MHCTLFISIWKSKKVKLPSRPLTVIFGGKAAPVYTIAKHVIHLILCFNKLINNDRKLAPHLQVVLSKTTM